MFINHNRPYYNPLLYISYDVTTYNIDVIYPLHNLDTVLLHCYNIIYYISVTMTNTITKIIHHSTAITPYRVVIHDRYKNTKRDRYLPVISIGRIRYLQHNTTSPWSSSWHITIIIFMTIMCCCSATFSNPFIAATRASATSYHNNNNNNMSKVKIIILLLSLSVFYNPYREYIANGAAI